MPEVFVKFNSMEEAMAALSCTLPHNVGAPTGTPVATWPAQQPQYPQPDTQQPYAPQPEQGGFTPPMPGNYAPQGAPAQAPTPPAPPAAPQIQQPPAGGPTSADVVKAAQAYAKKFGPAGTKAVLQQFGADAVKDVKPEHYANVIAALAV